LRRIRAASNNSRELPPGDHGPIGGDFFDKVLEESNAGTDLPTWNGELYLEFHRGTYTSHGSIKKGNRKSEILLRDVEHVATLASLYRYHKHDYEYPKAKIDVCWEKVLLNQCKYLLPGSAIGMVYDDAEKLYAEVREDGEALFQEATEVLLPKALPLTAASFKAPGNIVGINTTFFPRRDIVEVPLSGVPTHLKAQVVQTSKDGATGYALLNCPQGNHLAKPIGFYADCMPIVFTNGSDHFVLRNSAVQLTVSKGRITSLYDIVLSRELIAKGQTGGLVIFEDRPNYWDAWDVEIHHLETAHQLEFADTSVVSEGPLRASIKSVIKYGKSKITTTVKSNHGSSCDVLATTNIRSRPLIIFDAVVDWHERHEFLKFELPLDIRNDNATYETQFGHVQRPTHNNTTWDMAKFEVCGHKYADLSEFGYGVAILSESKYGFSCRGNVLRISLLRAATAPDAEQDQGKHEFSWAVLPHEGSFLESDVPIAAYLFNSPLHVRYVPGDAMAYPLAQAQQPFRLEKVRNVFLETIKRGEYDDYAAKIDDDNANVSVLLRLYEAYGGHARFKLRIGGNIARATVTNLLEDEMEELRIMKEGSGADPGDGMTIVLDFHAFEVKTLKFVYEQKASEDMYVLLCLSCLAILLKLFQALAQAGRLARR
ncbi:glycoside hydrolase family 38 protein, partial [Phanerochaete carnosa HHB-10118-sp]